MTSLEITAIITMVIAGMVVFGCWGYFIYNEYLKK
jgi:hypothetical protein